MPLAEFLLQRGILDERSVDFLKKAPVRLAGETLLSLGPEVRNPSAYITGKLAPHISEPAVTHVGGSLEATAAWRGSSTSPVQGAPQRHVIGAASAGHVIGSVNAVQVPPPAANGGEAITVHVNGSPRTLHWTSLQQAVDQLLVWNVLDDGSADFLMKASEAEAKEIVASLGPEVRNPSAFVTRKLKYSTAQEGSSLGGALSTPPAAAETLMIHHNGVQLRLEWQSQEQAVAQLTQMGVLDEGSADFLMKAPENIAKDIVSSLGPDVRRPSAFVTRRLRELSQDAGHEVLTIHHKGVPFQLRWTSQAAAVGQLQSMGMLDEGSADFLMKASEPIAKDIVASLGPDVRNPSAFVTSRMKELRGGAVQHVEPMLPKLTVHINGAPSVLEWRSREQVLEQLIVAGVLDQQSADFLTKVPEKAAWDILSALGPDVRNPSAFVTREARRYATRT